MKKIFFRFGCTVLLGVLIIGMAACNKGGNSAGSSSSSITITPGKLPYGDGKTSVTVFVVGGSDVVNDFSYEKNAWTKAVSDATGIMMDVTSSSWANGNERLTLMLNTNSYPEIIIYGLSTNDMNYYAKQGILQAMDEAALMKWPNIKGVFDEFPAVNQKVRGVDGKIYALPDVNDCMHCVYSSGRIWYYMPWMRDHGFKEPQTTAELEEYLRYVTSNDMNKNGQRNSMGIVFESGSLGNFISYFSKPFLPWVSPGLAMDGKTVVEQYRDPRFREALKWMNSLYRQGFIVPDSFTMTGDQVKTLWLGTTPRAAILANPWIDQGIERWINTFNLPPIQGPNGQRNAGNQEPWSIINGNAYMTDKLKNPELLYALYDYTNEFDVLLNGNVGPKGIAWDDPDPGTFSLSGGTPLYKINTSYGNIPLNSVWDQAQPMIRNTRFRMGQQASHTKEAEQWLSSYSTDTALMNLLLADSSYGEQMWYRTSLANSKYAMPESLFIPPIGMEDVDNERYSDINAVLNSYRDKAFTEFITGIRDINSDSAWNNYLTELDRLNSPELVKIIQKYIK